MKLATKIGLTDLDETTQIFFGVLLGVIISRLFHPILPIKIGEFGFTLSVLVFPVLFWIGIRSIFRSDHLTNSLLKLLFSINGGIIIDEFMYLSFRSGGVAYWSEISIIFPFIVALVMFGFLIILKNYTEFEYRESYSHYYILLLLVIPVISFLFFRISQTYLRTMGVPNDARSLIIMGYEIHHAAQGTFLIIISYPILLYSNLNEKIKKIVSIIFITGCSFVADQYLYMFYFEPTDALYFNMISTGGGFICTLFLLILITYTHNERILEAFKT